MIQFDEPLRRTFSAFDPARWAQILRVGLEQFGASVERGDAQHDYSGFGPAELFLERKPPASALVEFYDQLNVGDSKAKFRAGLTKVLDDMRAPPVKETLLIVSDLLHVIGAVRAMDAIDVLSRKFSTMREWRDTPQTYHASLQFAYKVATHGSSARLIRSLIGTNGQRSKCFSVSQIRSAVRVMTTSEPDRLANHLSFFEPEVGSATADIQQSIASGVELLRDVVDQVHWAAAQDQLPTWFRDAYKVVQATDTVVTAEMISRLIDQAFVAGTNPAATSREAAAAEARGALEDALFLASKLGHLSLIWAVDKIKERTERMQSQRSELWIVEAVRSYSGPVRQALDAYSYIRRAQDLITRVARHSTSAELAAGRRPRKQPFMLVAATSNDEESLLESVDDSSEGGDLPDTSGRSTSGG